MLHINDNKLIRQEYISSLVCPYIDNKEKPRLIEPPREDLKNIQTKIKNMLGKIIVPNNIFSGIKGRSYIDNAIMHTGNKRRYLFKIDMTAFFPSISREIVYQFFLNDLECSPDVANILTNFTTIDIDKSNVNDIDSINHFLISKNVSCRNHLISGAPTSQILSYLVNHNMFDEMQSISNKNNVIMTVYVDDITFSSQYRISKKFKDDIISIVKKYNYQISKKKVKLYTKLYPKLVTGVIIDSNGKPAIKNSMRKRIITEFDYYKDNPKDEKCRDRLRGLLIAARQVDKNSFQSIYNFAFNDK